MPSMRIGRCDISDQDRDRAVEMHTALHEGLSPKELLCEPWSNERVSHKIGSATEIQYIKEIPDEVPSYHHPWASQAQPTIGITPSGKLRFFAGKCETTRRGIEDRVTPGMPTVKYLKQPHVQREYLPSKPTGFITLGKLEWIKYNSNTRDGQGSTVSGSTVSGSTVSSTVKTLRFPKHIAPTIAHDQNGDLHVLGGQYLITELGVEENMAHARKHRRSRRSNHSMFGGYDNPRHSRRASRRGRRHARRNPVSAIMGSSSSGGSGMQRAGRAILSTGIVAGTAVVTAVAFDAAIANWAPLYPTPAKAAIKIGAGLLLGLGLASVTPQPLASIPAGIAIGGVFEGFRDLFNLYIGPSIVNITNPVIAPVITPPAAQVLMPGGIPQAYQAYSPQACGVAY